MGMACKHPTELISEIKLKGSLQQLEFRSTAEPVKKDPVRKALWYKLHVQGRINYCSCMLLVTMTVSLCPELWGRFNCTASRFILAAFQAMATCGHIQFLARKSCHCDVQLEACEPNCPTLVLAWVGYGLLANQN